MSVFREPFAVGLMLGLALAAVVLILGWFRQRALRSENKAKDAALAANAVVLVNAQVAFQIEIKGLRTENNNLKASVAALALKATNDEKRTLFVYQSAINAMTIGAPGFAGAWDKYLKEAHAELERVRDGQIPFIQKWFNRAKPLQTGTSVTSIENDSDR